MKKITPYILLFIIFVNLFTPFTPDFKNKKLISTVPKAEAAEKYYYSLNSGGFSKEFNTKPECDTALAADSSNTMIIGNLGSNTINSCIVVDTTYANKLNEDVKKIADAAAAKKALDGLPDCGISGTFGSGSGTITGCIAQGIYYILFVPVSWIFAFSGQFFDYTFGYSINSDSYNKEFVTNGWGVVRDFCNMFFIFVLLYVAIATILDLNHFKTKEMIINVVIIGVLINFSMLAAHLMIDASNILARVFYNNNTITITKGTSNALIKPGAGGVIPLSEALVNKFDPQSIVLDGHKNMGLKGLSGDVADKNSEVGTGTFILITLLSTALSIYGIIVFISVGLIFIARVIGLWFAIIFAPLAFFSYTVPQMQGISMFGWKKWWSTTIGLCFLAPIFMFFMYLIIAFLEKFSLGDARNAHGMEWWILMIVPFVFIMMLMMKAKDIAKEYSGSLGQSITNGLAAAGGLALGAGAAGLAMAGRNTIGEFGKSMASDGARKNALEGKDIKEAWKNTKVYNPLSWVNLAAKTATGGVKFVAAGATKLADNSIGVKGTMKELSSPEVKRKTEMVDTGILGSDGKPVLKEVVLEEGKDAVYNERNKTWRDVWKEKEKKPRDTAHAKHIYDEKLKAMHITEPWGDLTEDQQSKIKESIDKDLLAKQYFKAKDYSSLKKEMKDDIDNMYKGTGIIITENNSFGKKGDSIKDLIAKQDPHSLREGKEGKLLRATEDGHLHDAEYLSGEMKGAGIAVGEFLAAVRKGSYDIRKLSEIKTGSKDFGAKSMVGLTAAVALGMRSGMKQSGIDYGKGQKDFMKDMGDLITSSLKNVKIEVPKGGDGGGHDDHGHGGGHDDHGGGHH